MPPPTPQKRRPSQPTGCPQFAQNFWSSRAALPPSLEESARLLGRRPAAVFRTVVLPQIRPAIGAGALLVFLMTVRPQGLLGTPRVEIV